MIDLAAHWLWWALASVMLIVELLTGSGFLLAMAIAATLAGIYAYTAPFATDYQFMVFGVLAFLIAAIWWFLCKRLEKEIPTNSFINQRLQKMVGQTAEVTQAIHNGRGRAKIGDTEWPVICAEDLPVGRAISVIDIKGTALIVTAL